MSIIAIIPARGGSKRLLRKNIHPVFGKPMLGWAIEVCERSGYVDETFVSTEDAEIAGVARSFGASVIMRPDELADDKTAKMEVIRHADRWYRRDRGRHARILISVQANSPELSHRDIDKGVELLQRENLWEIISIGPDHVQNASFRVLRQTCLYNTFLSAHIGAVLNDCTDVHTLDDVIEIEHKYRNINALIEQVT